MRSSETAKIDTAAKLAAWWQKVSARTNNTFLPLYACDTRYLVLMGGAGSGKSIFAGQKLIERAVQEAGHRILVCRKVGNTLSKSCFEQLRNQIRDMYPDLEVKINLSTMTITLPNGSVFLFTGLDDVEKLKSIYNITMIWIEEASELLESDFNQLDIRLRGVTKYYKQIIITFNPISITHWLKKRFFDVKDPKITAHKSTYKDNKFLDDEAIRTLEAFKEIDEYYYEVYCLGNWGVLGKSVFDAKSLNRRLQTIAPPVEVGYFAGRQFVPDKIDGFIRIFEQPKAGYPYVIGADTAGEGSDYFAAWVIDNTTGRQVAVLHKQHDEDMFAEQIEALGYYYNTALIALEINFSSYPVLYLEKRQYPNMYMREEIDDFTHKIKKAFGFRTDSKTRPVIIANLIKIVRDDVTLINDEATIHEMLTFVRNEDFRPEAAEGAHDDLVMAGCIAHYARPHMRYNVESAQGHGMHWTEDMMRYFENADESEREYLLKKWGNPN